ncbi:fimbrial assembly family protein [Acidovorax sp. NO-1]|uniref:PilN domain-containing protein n=1 Tax=Acidovorax sp. NO-1 TaxID=512030 RepID=UPI00023FCDD5|nr:PilN domain-containing protein [Acidovorax sp. NO-1]EHL24489.1 fimbrial assembly family protein [Acidovorax sp. NO-1]
MSPTASPPRFFGLDTHRLRDTFAQAWAELRDGPILDWFTPAARVRWFRAEGPEERWLASGGRLVRDKAGAARAAPFAAIEVPDAIVLRRHTTLPALAPAAAAQAMALDATTHSPFPPDELVWGARSTSSTLRRGWQDVEIVLASRRLIQQHLATQPGAPALDSCEAWCLSEKAAEPIVLTGFAESRRQRVQRRGRNLNLALAATALVLLAAVAITPSLQLRARALAAMQDYERLARQAAPALAQRESLVRSEDQLAELRTILGEQADPLQVMDLLTRALPDDSSLLTVNISGLKVTLTGQTANSAALLERLGNEAGLREVRAPTAATRPPGATKDTFTIEAQIDPAALQRSTAADATHSAETGKVPTQPPVAAASAPATAASSPASAASAAIAAPVQRNASSPKP